MLNQVILLVGTICISTSFLKTSSGNLVKSILTKRSIRVHYMISTSSEISKFIAAQTGDVSLFTRCAV